MQGHSSQRSRRRAAALVCAAACVSLALALTGAARAQQGSDRAAGGFSIALTALTGPQGADLTIALDTGSEAKVETLKKVQLKVYAGDGSLAFVRNINDQAAPGGVATIALGRVDRNRAVEAEVLVQPGEAARTFVVRGKTLTKLRPDLVVAAVHAPAQTTAKRPIDVVVDVAERGGDTGANATVTLTLGNEPLAQPAAVTVAPGAQASVRFEDVTLAKLVATELTVQVKDAAPAETDAANNAGAATVEVTEHELAFQNVLVPSLGGYGAQFNQHLYAPMDLYTPFPRLTPDDHAKVETRMKALQPQLVRIFYNDIWEENRRGDIPNYQDNYASFIKVCQLAQASGAIINVTFHTHVFARFEPEASMGRFAQVLDDLVRVHGCTNVRWATVGNEPNSGNDRTNISLEQLDKLYRTLHAELVRRGLRDHVRLMGGDLVESAGTRDHHVWMKWIAEHTGDILDAYAEHIYWIYNQPGRMEYRLRDTAKLVMEVLPPEQRKPTYLMEYGIRGLNTCGTKRPFAFLYYADEACTEIWRTNLAAFHHLWFNIASAQLGFSGTSKWDAYWAMYDRSSPGNQSYWLTGPASEGYPRTPTYNAMSLLFHTTDHAWQVIRVEPWDSSDSSYPRRDVSGDPPEKELAAYTGPNGEVTLIGLDTNGRFLNMPSPESASYSIGGLPPNTNFRLALWNATGDGENAVGRTIATGSAGVARFDVPLHAAFALTTVPVS